MVIAVRTEERDGTLVVVKQARTDGDVGRLTTEATVLQSCDHPGLVALLEVHERSLVISHAGTALARLGPFPLDQAAAIGSAIGDALHALHRSGWAHADLDAEHVLLDQAGVPRLCGFGRSTPATPDSTAEDVRALGTLVAALLDEGATLRWAAPPPGLGRRRARRRARKTLDALVGRCARTKAEERPTARQFAKAVYAAVPGATLPSVATEHTGAPGYSALPDEIDPTADLRWTADDLAFLARDARRLQDEHETDLQGDEAAHEDERARIEVPPHPAADDLFELVPPQAERTRSSTRRRLRRAGFVLLLALALAGGGIAGAAGARAVKPFGADPASPASIADAAVRAPVATWPASCNAVPPFGPDLDGDGCPERVDLDGRIATVGDARFQVGDEGDEVALGDWDCDGIDTPAVLRVPTGEVFVFDRWSPEGPVEAPSIAVVEGATAIEADGDACPVPAVTTADARHLVPVR